MTLSHNFESQKPKPAHLESETRVDIALALNKYQDYQHAPGHTALVKEHLVGTLGELNALAGKEMFIVTEVTIPGDARTFYKIVLKNFEFNINEAA